jgi:hypothetical protein
MTIHQTQTDKRTDGQAGRQKDRETERQTYKQTDRLTDRQTDKHKNNFIVSVPTYFTLSLFRNHLAQIKMYFLKFVNATKRLKGKQTERQTDTKTNRHKDKQT